MTKCNNRTIQHASQKSKMASIYTANLIRMIYTPGR